jgi:hypothetical protein
MMTNHLPPLQNVKEKKWNWRYNRVTLGKRATQSDCCDVGCCIQQLYVSDISLQQGIPGALETPEYIL